MPCSIDHNCKELGEFIVVDVGVGARGCILEGVLEVDIAGGREVQLSGVCELEAVGPTPAARPPLALGRRSMNPHVEAVTNHLGKESQI